MRPAIAKVLMPLPCAKASNGRPALPDSDGKSKEAEDHERQHRNVAHLLMVAAEPKAFKWDWKHERKVDDAPHWNHGAFGVAGREAHDVNRLNVDQDLDESQQILVIDMEVRVPNPRSPHQCHTHPLPQRSLQSMFLGFKELHHPLLDGLDAQQYVEKHC